MIDIAIFAVADAVVPLWNGILKLFRWIFIEDCSTATALLSLSFAINTIFTGLSLSRFNLCSYIRRNALQQIGKIVDDKFLRKLERLGKANKDICSQLQNFSRKQDKYRRLMESESILWERIRRATTVTCAIIAFVFVAFELKSRVGVALVVPYLIFLFCHALWVIVRTLSLIISFHALAKAMDKAEQKPEDEFNIDDCIKKLRENHQALSPCTKKRKAHPREKR